MVVTSVRWLFFAVSFSVLTIQTVNSGKMTYGLVYRPAGLYAGASSTVSASSSSPASSTTSTEKSKLEANETAISAQTEQPDISDINESSISLSKITQSNVSLSDDSDSDGSKFTENDILPWLMQSAANPPYKPKSKPVKASTHQYEVTEDPEADG
ncbi:uncharacterized protein LOC135842164 [Planococcus citri]|uniref:uncharacterized protein LOC135842164 n=1 Tax=Planococcus citri TaxID=170843 RepID=UPI0031F80536